VATLSRYVGACGAVCRGTNECHRTLDFVEASILGVTAESQRTIACAAIAYDNEYGRLPNAQCQSDVLDAAATVGLRVIPEVDLQDGVNALRDDLSGEGISLLHALGLLCDLSTS
jgi:hypothetical protein